MKHEPPRYQANYQALEQLLSAREDPWRFATDSFERKRLERTVAACLKVPHRSILEVGCAEGHMTAPLTTIAQRVAAIDAAPAAVARAAARAPAAEVITSSLESLALAEHFDLAVCTETLYYCQDVAGALALLCERADFVLLSYTVQERRTLDGYFNNARALHDEVVRGINVWKEPPNEFSRGLLARAWGLVNYKPQVRGCRILLFWSGGLPWAAGSA
ncbi:MAG TPA: SAM-dependent methyltransferase [Candidatus Binataceae bacterium]|nr:SAM-dependent methyltransferase [Candidatus Binataceae bacterium]